MVVAPRKLKLTGELVFTLRSPQLREATEFRDSFRRIASGSENQQNVATTYWGAMSDESARQMVKHQRSSPSDFAICVFLRDRIVGTITVTGSSGPLYQHNSRFSIALEQDFRDQGLGAALLDFALKTAKTSGFRRMEFTTFAQNKGMLALARKFKFSRSGHLKKSVQIGGRFFDELIFERQLGPAKK